MKQWVVGMAFLFFLGCQSARLPMPENLKQGDISRAASAFGLQGEDVKYCPVDGKHFSSRLEKCPEHAVLLIPVEP